jgi:hypothetical protein
MPLGSIVHSCIQRTCHCMKPVESIPPYLSQTLIANAHSGLRSLPTLVVEWLNYSGMVSSTT